MQCAPLAAVLTCIINCCWIVDACAWSADGHREIAVQAFESITLKQQQALADVLAAGPWALEKSKVQTHLDAAAVWPDRIREHTLQQLFTRHGSGQVPRQLRSYRYGTTAQWHFVNAQFLTTEGRWVAAGDKPDACPPQARGELYTVWPRLLSAYDEALDTRDKAILLAFIVHLVSDAYQPLHVAAALDATCRDDSGGNGYCVVKAGARCTMNLHQLWDRGFGAFEGDWYTPVDFRGDVGSLHQRLPIDSGTLLYPKNPREALSANYQRKAATRVAQQASAAAAHLRQVLMGLDAVNVQ